jgi:uncharacterized coiled-coil protein SlyX
MADKDSDQDQRIAQLECKLNEQQSLIDRLSRETGLQNTVYSGFSELADVLKPLRGLRPLREMDDEDGAGIENLRASLRRPQFEILENHFDPFKPGKKKQEDKPKREAAR